MVEPVLVRERERESQGTRTGSRDSDRDRGFRTGHRECVGGWV